MTVWSTSLTASVTLITVWSSFSALLNSGTVWSTSFSASLTSVEAGISFESACSVFSSVGSCSTDSNCVSSIEFACSSLVSTSISSFCSSDAGREVCSWTSSTFLASFSVTASATSTTQLFSFNLKSSGIASSDVEKSSTVSSSSSAGLDFFSTSISPSVVASIVSVSPLASITSVSAIVSTASAIMGGSVDSTNSSIFSGSFSASSVASVKSVSMSASVTAWLSFESVFSASFEAFSSSRLSFVSSSLASTSILSSWTGTTASVVGGAACDSGIVLTTFSASKAATLASMAASFSLKVLFSFVRISICSNKPLFSEVNFLHLSWRSWTFWPKKLLRTKPRASEGLSEAE